MADTNPHSPVQRRQAFEESTNAPYEPQVGDVITVEIPDERTRATIHRVISRSRVIAKINSFTTSNKSHNYKKDDFVAAEYRRGAMNQNGWHEISQSQLDAAPIPEPEEAAVPREMIERDFMPARTRKAK